MPLAASDRDDRFFARTPNQSLLICACLLFGSSPLRPFIRREAPMYRILIPVPFIMLALLVLPALRAEDKKEKPKFKLTDAEQKIFDMTNEARKKEKLPALKLSQILCEVARAH